MPIITSQRERKAIFVRLQALVMWQDVHAFVPGDWDRYNFNRTKSMDSHSNEELSLCRSHKADGLAVDGGIHPP